MLSKFILTTVLLIFGFICCLQSISMSASTNGKDKSDVVFKWAFVASKLSEQHENLVPITKDTVLQSGDRFKILVEVESDCFVYVLFKSSEGEIVNLLSRSLTEEDGIPLEFKKKTYIPGIDSWFTLDEKTGLEKVYLLASASRLGQLESLIREYEAVSAEQKQEIADRILKTMKNIRRQNKRFRAKVARPKQIGGMLFRGISENQVTSRDINSFAMTIESEKFFAKTFTIEHK